MILLLLLVAGLVALAIGAAGGGSHGPSARTRNPNPAVKARRPSPPHAGLVSPPRSRPAPADDRGVQRVLGYTPFVTSGGRQRRLIALTFDDGPSPYTGAVVGILVRMHVPATFFIVGQQLRYFSAGLRDEFRHGFTVGDHTENHAWLVRLAAGGQAAQIGGAAAAVQHLGAPLPRLFRPPYGEYDRVTLSVLHSLRMLMVLWSVDPGDWRRPGVKAIVAGVLSHATPGAIVIMHDGGGDRSQTVAALPAVIRGLRRLHYGLVSVPQLLALDPPRGQQRLPLMTGA